MRFFPLVLFGCIALMLLFVLAKPKQAADVWVGRALPALQATPIGKEAIAPIAIKDMTLINLFASWCTPCLAEHPQLKTLQARGLTIIGIAWNDTPEAVGAFLERHGNPYAQVFIDHKGEAAIPLGVHGIPESFLVDANGRVLYHLAGPLDAARVEQDILPLLEASDEP